MASVLTLATSLPEFSKFLLETFGIEKNEISIVDAVRAAKTAAWHSYCEAWGSTAPDLVRLHVLLGKVHKPVATAPRMQAERMPLSPDSQRRVDAEKKLKSGMPDMTNPKLGPRINQLGVVLPAVSPFDLARLGVSTGHARHVVIHRQAEASSK